MEEESRYFSQICKCFNSNVVNVFLIDFSVLLNILQIFNSSFLLIGESFKWKVT